MSSGSPPAKSSGGGGLSLYADLLDPPTDTTASISRAPQVSREALEAVKDQESAAAKKPVDPSLRFQPFQSIRRPQPKTQKPKATFPKVAAPAAGGAGAGAASGGNGLAAAASSAPAPVKSTLADWAATEDDEWMYAGEKRPRGGKKKKKNRNAPAETNWDEIYDPSRPTNVDEYLRSDEHIQEVREWKALLYKHRRPAKRQASWDSDEDEDRPMTNQFAPPPAYSFAPPPLSPPRAAAVSLPDDKTGEDVYARRLALSQVAPPPPPQSTAPPPPPNIEVPPPPPPDTDSSTISRAPVRYTQPSPPPEGANPDPDAMDEDTPAGDDGTPATDSADDTAPRSNRPGQKGFAARLMSKYGWSKGQGLGAEGTGMLAPLRVQVEKRKKKSDADGGGWAEPGGRGRIIEPKMAKNPSADTDTPSSSTVSDAGGKFGALSNVIVLRRMLDNIEDLPAEIEGGLGQEIGEECGDKYGRVERLYINASGAERGVYIKFVDAVSALRAVNALDGRVFAGSAIEPRFYDSELFEKGVYE